MTPTIQLYDEARKTFGLSLNYESSRPYKAYKISQIQGDWWHIEIPISALAQYYSGYRYYNETQKKWIIENAPIPLDKKVMGVKLGNGTSKIDNLRIGCTSQDLGIYNGGYSFSMSDGKPYLIKVSWSGKFHDVSYVFTPDTVASHLLPEDDPNIRNNSQFYVEGKTTGTVTVDITMTVGYKHETKTAQTTLTVNP